MGHWTTVAVLLAAAAAATAPRGSQLRIETSSDGIAIKAVAVPLADVLDRIARETGMKVLYDGAPPRKPVTLSLTRRNSVDMVNAVLQEAGVNYAVVLDPSRTRIARLLVTTAAPPPKRRLAAAPAPDAEEPLDEPAAPAEGEGSEATPASTPTPRPEPTLLPTPVPPPTSPFTPQGPGPVLFPFLGSTPPPEPPPG